MDATYLRVAGWLSDANVFSPLTGWETRLIKRRPMPNSEYVFRLVDSAEHTLVEVAAAINGHECRSSRICGHDKRRLTAYVPLHADAAEIRLLRDSRVLYRTSVASSPPQASELSVDARDPRRVRVRWRATSERSYRVFVFLIDGAHRAIRIGSEVTDEYFEFDAMRQSGGRGCRVALIVSDGVRSSSYRSDSFDLPTQPPTVRILTPAPQEPVSPVHHFSLIGRVTDAVGRFLDEGRLVWRIDGTVFKRGSCFATIEEPEPGQRQIDLEYEGEDGVHATDRITLDVRNLSSAELEWRRASAAFVSRDCGLSLLSRPRIISRTP